MLYSSFKKIVQKSFRASHPLFVRFDILWNGSLFIPQTLKMLTLNLKLTSQAQTQHIVCASTHCFTLHPKKRRKASEQVIHFSYVFVKAVSHYMHHNADKLPNKSSTCRCFTVHPK